MTQLDRELNPEFYTGHLDADTYHRWLLDHAVAIVALPLGRLRDASLDEAAVIHSNPSYLRKVWENDDWQVFDVVDALTARRQRRRRRRRGTRRARHRRHANRMDEPEVQIHRSVPVSEGDACLAPADGGWIRISSNAPGASASRSRSRSMQSSTAASRRAHGQCRSAGPRHSFEASTTVAWCLSRSASRGWGTRPQTSPSVGAVPDRPRSRETCRPPAPQVVGAIPGTGAHRRRPDLASASRLPGPCKSATARFDSHDRSARGWAVDRSNRPRQRRLGVARRRGECR